MLDSNTRRVLRGVGVRGGFKTLTASLRHAGDLRSLVFSKNTSVQIDPASTVEVDSTFVYGINMNGPRGYDLGKSLFAVGEEGTVCIRDSAWIGYCSWVNVKGEFEMGNSYISSHARINCFDSVSIGDGCAIAWEMEFLDNDLHSIVGSDAEQSGPITVGDDVWIGSRVSVKKGVDIGRGSVIASDSVVTDDVPPHSLAAGVPAEVVEDYVQWE